MASYMDMVTVLMCMFIVLFAMSSVDADKFAQLRNSLATGFGSVNVGSIDTATGVVVPANQVDSEEEAFAGAAPTPSPTDVALTDVALTDATLTDAQRATAEVDDLTRIEAQIHTNLQSAGMDELVQFNVDERGLTVGLVGSETFFAPDQADLSAAAIAILDAMAPVLVASEREISVEGHADKHGQTVNYATDWELSAGRSTRVLRRLVEQGGVQQERIAAIGYGAARPASTGSALADMAMNRRVDVVLLSNLPDTVRSLIPGVLAGVVPADSAVAG
ncbi:chemotaxis protein MotB [Cryobacterium sp. CG_9.6]|nr:chemotaxis protein MotB [Cryobacterium sp. CG_9.6]